MARRAANLTRQQMLQPAVLDLSLVVDDVQRLLSRIIGADIALTFEPEPDLWPVRADRGHLRAVLHDQGARPGHRARARDHLRDREAEWRRNYLESEENGGTTFSIYLP